MNFSLVAFALIAGLLLGMFVCSEIGRRLGRAQLVRDGGGLAKGIGAAEGAVFALLGLLIAFTFSGAASRFEERRHLVTQEANAIGTAYLRIDLLPRDAQPELRSLFRRYVDIRAATYRNLRSAADAEPRIAEANMLQGQIWSRAVAASLGPDAPPQAAILLLPALNEMIDITATRVGATRNHPPLVIYLLLIGFSLIGALLVGYDTSANKARRWLHTLAFAAILALTTYIIVDIEFPRLGLIRVESADLALDDLRRSMN